MGQCWQLLEVAPFSQECAGWGIFSVPEGISKVQIAGGSLPMHLFPLISFQVVERHPRIRLHPSCSRCEMRWTSVVERNSLLVSWCCSLLPTLGWPILGHCGFLCTSWWLSREALPQIRLETFSALGAVRWWHAPAVRLEEGDTKQLGTPNPCHFGVFLLCCWRCDFSA